MQIIQRLFIGAVAAILCFANTGRADLAVGSSIVDVVRGLGQPDMKVNQGKRLVYYYAGGAVEFEQGQVVAVDGDLFDRIQQRAEDEAFEQAQRDMGRVKFDGQWMTRDQAHELRTEREKTARIRQIAAAAKRGRRVSPARTGSTGPSVTVVKNGGQKIDIKQYAKPGRVTIVDFYADWCGPCRKISPYLEQLATANADIHLVKIDIVNWETPVVKQFGLSSIPSMRVYGRKGQMVGSPTSSLKSVHASVQKQF